MFYTILTALGKAKLASAQVSGTAVNFTHMAVGDGNGAYYDPQETQTALVREKWRGALNQVAIDPNNPNWIVIEMVIPISVGGFMIREAGVFDTDGDMIAIGKYPETYKPVLAEGTGKDLYMRMILEVTNASVVTLVIDPNIVTASKNYVDQKINTAAWDYYGDTDPTTINGMVVRPFFRWVAHTAKILYLRNLANTGWIEFMDLNTGNILTGGSLASDLVMNGHKITNLAAGVNSGDAVNMGQFGYLSGVQKFPSGFMMQWGNASPGLFNFAVGFPNACSGILGATTSSFNQNGATFTSSGFWLAIGH
jgi:hypothetical protein